MLCEQNTEGRRGVELVARRLSNTTSHTHLVRDTAAEVCTNELLVYYNSLVALPLSGGEREEFTDWNGAVQTITKGLGSKSTQFTNVTIYYYVLSSVSKTLIYSRQPLYTRRRWMRIQRLRRL